MMKKYLSAFAVAAMIGVTGCDTSEDTIIEDPVLEETTPPPVTTEPAPVTTPMPETPAMPLDTAAAGTETTPDATAPTTPSTTTP